ncbi:MAG: carboxypeptidase M32 [Betaproteobacteria bacterium]|nr:MAG: carboxypeptidase M32 [Betaproteobacteria bacterium]
MVKLSAYQKLEKRFARIHLLKSIGHLLRWDGEVMMPPASIGIRAEQLSLLETESNSILRASQTGRLLDSAETSRQSLDDWEQANLREMRRLWQHANAIPNRLVNAFHRATTNAEMQWRTAVEQNDFGMLEVPLERVIAVVHERAQVLGDALRCSPYDALLDEHDPGRRATELDGIFARIRCGLTPLIPAIMDRQSSRPTVELAVPVAVARQKDLCKRIMKGIGFPFEKGRLDESLHPFTEGTAEDIRITSRFDPDNFFTGLMGVLHEVGHAMYDFGLPAKWATQPVGRDRGMAIHESQALFLEMVIGRSRAFMNFCAPLVARIFGVSGAAWTSENLYGLATRVKRSLIRIHADEVTYPMHVVLRWELEQDLFRGTLRVKDLPGAWNEKMRSYLQVVPQDAKSGCLQDSHWPMGYFGYFPTYLMGSVIAAQLFAAVRCAVPDIMSRIEAGDFEPLFSWLGRNIHGQGARFTGGELVERASGHEVNPDYLISYLRDKYLLQ